MQLMLDDIGNIVETNKIQKAIQRLKEFEPAEGYYLAFSGGKDSLVIYHLAKEAGVKFDAHYNLTTVDPPELVDFIRENYPDVIWDKPKITMWKLIPKKKMPPSRRFRYCCEVLKEHGGEGRFVVTGVRWAESSKRRESRHSFELFVKDKDKKRYTDDNNEARRMFENCIKRGKYVINPILDWEDDDVWEYIKSRNIKYCSLYDEGFKRLGCVGCPLNQGNMEREFLRWPKYKENYIKAFEKMIIERNKSGRTDGWKTGEEVMDWWLNGKSEEINVMEGQEDLWDGDDD